MVSLSIFLLALAKAITPFKGQGVSVGRGHGKSVLSLVSGLIVKPGIDLTPGADTSACRLARFCREVLPPDHDILRHLKVSRGEIPDPFNALGARGRR
jgi:hypothetical protein